MKKTLDSLTCAVLTALVLLSFSLTAAAQADTAPQGSEVFVRQVAADVWKQQVDGADFSAKKDISLKAGDVLVARENTVIIRLDSGPVLTVMPYSVVRLHAKASASGAASTVPELLFGEMLLKGNGQILFPGQSVDAKGIIYLVVDDEKFSMVAVADGSVAVTSAGATASLSIPIGNYLELGPAGEAGVPDAMLPEDIELYTKMSPKEGVPFVALASGEPASELPPLPEVWTRERLMLIKDGPESETGLAISRGETQKKNTGEDTPENIQIFDKTKGSQKKTLSFSTTVASDKKTAEAPKLTSITIARKQATIGETLNIRFKDLESKTIVIAGKAFTPEPDQWRLFVKINGEESKIDSMVSFEQIIRVSQDFANSPKIIGTTIGETRAESLVEGSVLTRENMTSGKMVVAGMAEAGKNILNYTIDFIARDTEDKEYPVGTFKVELDLSEIARVEVSTDGGIGWEPAKGTGDWTYSFTPSNSEKYKVKIRTYDVMDNVSEDQMEPYEFLYLYKTDAEQVREVFDMQMRAFLDKDRATFFRYVAQDFRSNLEDMRDYNELYTSVQERFSCCNVNIRYTIREVDASRSNNRGTVDFYWQDRSGVSSETNSAFFYYILEESEWKLVEVVDPNTFLRASRIPYRIDVTVSQDRLNADGESTLLVRAHVLDNAGSIVADNVPVSFIATSGSFNPAVALTGAGYADTTYIAGTSPSQVTITAMSGGVSGSAVITLDPVAPPGPPGE